MTSDSDDKPDFRGVSWGMSYEEVHSIEEQHITYLLPAFIILSSTLDDEKIRIIYQFQLDNDSTICVGAAISPESVLFNNFVFDHSQPMPALTDVDKILECRELDVDRLERFYESLKKQISVDYGDPEILDGELKFRDDTIANLSEVDNLDKAEILRYCKRSFWETNSTLIELSIFPLSMGEKSVSAEFRSVKHLHLFPKPE